MRHWRTIAFSSTLLVTGIAASMGASESAEGPIDKTAPSHLIGTWKQLDAGRHLTISEETVDVYHHTKFLCYKDEPASGKPLAESYARYALEDDGSTLTLWIHDFGEKFDRFWGRRTFVRVPGLPPKAVVEPSADARFRDPEFVFELVWHTFDEQFPFFEQRNFDWGKRFRRFRPMVTPATTDEQLYQVMTGMLAGLGDSHTRIYWDQRAQPFKSGRARVLHRLDDAFDRQDEFTDAFRFRGDWSQKGKSAVSSRFVDGKLQSAANKRIRWGRLHGSIGYVRLDSLTGFSPKGTTRAEEVEMLGCEMDRIVEQLWGCKAVIIDLSFNGGGYDAAGMVIASRFADKRRHALSTYSAGQKPSMARRCFVRPAGPRQYTRPVYVLTTNGTVSAGESLVLMLKAFSHVTHVGETTRGCLSGILNKGMPNAFHVTMSNQFWVSPEGTAPEGFGIAPDIEFPVFDSEDLFGGYPNAVGRVIELVDRDDR